MASATAPASEPRTAGKKARTNGSKPPAAYTPEGSQRQLLSALRSIVKGDFSVRLPTAQPGIDGDIAEAFNDVVNLNAALLAEFQRISEVVGRDGRIAQRADITPAAGSWSTYIKSVNELIDDLTHPIVKAALVKVSKKIPVRYFYLTGKGGVDRRSVDMYGRPYFLYRIKTGLLFAVRANYSIRRVVTVGIVSAVLIGPHYSFV